MPEKSKVIDGKLVTNPVGERVEDEYIHIYPSMKMSIRLAHSFVDELYDLGYKPVERTDDRSTPVDLPVNVMLVDDELVLLFYRHDWQESTTSRLHNFVIESIPEHVESRLRTKADVVSSVKFQGPAIAIGEVPQVIHMYFDLKCLEKLGRKEDTLDSWFGD